MILAEHFELGTEHHRAVFWLIRAAQRELEGGNGDDAELLVQRGIACGAKGVDHGQLHAIRAQAASLRADWPAVAQSSAEAATTLVPGSLPWFAVTAHSLLAGSFLADLSISAHALQSLVNTPVHREKSGPYAMAVCCASQGLAYAGQLADAEALIAQAESNSGSDDDLVFSLWLRTARGHLQTLQGDLGDALTNLSAADLLANRSGASFAGALVGFFSVLALGQTGHVERAAQAAARTRQICEQLNLPVIVDWITLIETWLQLEATLDSQPVIASMHALVRRLLERQDHLMRSAAHAFLSHALLRTDALVEAEQHAVLACETAILPMHQAYPLGMRANIELCRSRPEAALEYAQRGLEAAARVAVPATEAMLRLAQARALHALQHSDQAWAAIAFARERVLRVAGSLDPELRDAFTRTQSNAGILQLAHEWLDKPAH